MKKLITLAFCLYVMPGLFAQNVQRYDSNSPWFLGLNVGAAWNSTDIENETNAGWGLTFGRSFTTRPDALFAWDLRMRYLQGNWYGQDYDTTNLANYVGFTPNEYQSYADNPGFTVNNFQARNHHLGLELVLHANRLRQRTGWDPYIFGGANLTWNQTFSDLVNIDSSALISGQYVYDPTLLTDGFLGGTQLDGIYETAMNPGSFGGDYNLDFMPSLGVGIAYYPGPRFALGLEHKSTFTRKDDWDGYIDPEPGLWGRSNDIYHYTNFFLRFHLRGRGSVEPQPDPVVDCPDPIIQLQRPNVSNSTVENQVYAFRAQIENINSIQNVRVRVNGVESNNFFYSTTTRLLEGSLVLNEGANTIQVVASNSCGSDTETITINYNPCRVPLVRFTDPSQRSINVENPVYRVRASIANGGSINYTINGVASSNFFYQQGNGSFESTVNLREGSNTITITTTNDCGTDTETITIVYTDCEDPRINFASGNGSLINVTSPTALIRSTIFGIDNKNAIGFRVNGSNRTFNYNVGSNQLEANVTLFPGANRIEINVGNECGTDVETITVNYTPCSNPIVNILTPVRSGSRNTSGTQLIEASVTNATNVSQIQMLVNGVQVAGGNFNPVTRIYSNTAALNAGTNIIQIIVNNECGSDSETTNVLYEVNCPVPMISLASTITTTHQATLPIQYVVQNITSASQITLMLNGVPVQGGFFNSQSNVFSATLALTEGANTITINATNNCGQDSETIVVYYTQPCDDPIIAMINPFGNQLSVTDAQFDVQAILQNVTSANQVQLTVNGSMDISGSYNHITQVYHNSINLQPGLNTIMMEVDNGCSTETEIFVIDYSPCLQPVVSITSPNGGSTQNSNAVVSATVLNVANANDIEVIVNGVVYAGTYNATTGAFTASVPLNAGTNNIQVIATNECGTISQSVCTSYAPCSTPTVQFGRLPGGIQNTQTVTIFATITGVNNASEITTLHNGNPVTGTYNATTNQYSVTITLTPGLNSISVAASNDCGSDSQSTTINYVEPCDAPQVSITSPATGTSSANATTQLTASLANVTNANQVQLIVNGNAQTGNLNTTSGAFTATINLQQGVNIIQVIATTDCGSASETIRVLYRPCLVPNVQLVAPQAGTTQNGTTTLQAVVTNVNSANEITLTVNGQSVSGSYNATSNMFTANVTLTNGSNNIVVTATNNCGHESESVTITYNEPCLSPQVSIATPTNNAQVATNSVQIAATIVNISSAGEVQLLVNGTTHQGAYNSTTNAYTATVPLQSGNNIIEIISSNDCGTATETVTVFYHPCVTPGIQIVAPVQTTTTNANLNFQAVLSSVASGNDVTVTLNGNAVSGSFNTVTNTYTAALTLVSGSNTIEINATNACGSDSHVRTITYNEPCTAPQITFNTPNGTTVNTNSAQISATVTGTTGGSSVQMTLNGIQQYVSVDANQGTLSANVNLNQGANAIVLSATNECGTTTETLTINYTPCLPPVVQITAPQAGTSANQTVSVVASVTGVERAAAIQTSVNGNGVTGVYDETAETYTVQVTLQTGPNTITITAGNECGVDAKSLTLIYDEPCDAPTVSILKPTNNSETSESQVGLSAKITNIETAQEVEVTVNGTLVSGGSYDKGTKLYTTSVPISEPINKIVVRVDNTCGTATAKVIVSQVTEPTMLICNPVQGGAFEQIEIPVSQWPQYQAAGATQGECHPGSGTGIINQGGSGSGSSQNNGTGGGTQSNTYGGQTGGGLIGGGGTTTVGNGGGTSGSGTGTGGTTGGTTGGNNNGGTNAGGTSGGGTTGGGTSGGNGGSGTGGRDANTGTGGTDMNPSQQAAQEASAKKAAQEAAAKKAAQEEAAKKAAQEAAAKKAAQEAAAKKAAQEAAAKKAAQEAAAKKAAQEAAAKKAAQEAAAKKAAQEAAAKKAAQEAADKKAAQEAAAKKAAQEAAAKKAAQEAAAKKAAQEAAAKKAAQEAAAKKAAQEAAAKKAAQEAAAKKAAQEAAAKKAAQEAAAKKAAQEAAAKKAAQEAAAKKAAQEAAAKKAAEEAAKKKAAEEAAKKKAGEGTKTPVKTSTGGGIR